MGGRGRSGRRRCLFFASRVTQSLGYRMASERNHAVARFARRIEHQDRNPFPFPGPHLLSHPTRLTAEQNLHPRPLPPPCGCGTGPILPPAAVPGRARCSMGLGRRIPRNPDRHNFPTRKTQIGKREPTTLNQEPAAVPFRITRFCDLPPPPPRRRGRRRCIACERPLL